VPPAHQPLADILRLDRQKTLSERGQELIEQRQAKLERLRAGGCDPYPARYHRTHTAQEAGQALQALEEKGGDSQEAIEVSLAGRITAMRLMGKRAFIDLRDGTGKIQADLRQDVLGDESYQAFVDLVDIGDFVGVSGTLFRTRSGEITVQARQYVFLAKALRPLPEKWHGLQDVEVRYRQRYLDLMVNAPVRDVFRLRSRVVAAIRRFLDERGFLEVETPVLQPSAGGAAAKPFVTHHHALDRDLYLRVATELHLKRLIVGGLDRVYEIGPVFRNEGVSTKHNPEYTLLECYQAYADYQDIMKLVEEMVAYAAQQALGGLKVPYGDTELDLTPPWQRLTLRQAIEERTGIDFEAYPDADSLRQAMAGLGQRGLPFEAIVRGLEVPTTAGRGKLIDELLSTFVEPRIMQPTFLLDYPLELSPLAKRKPDNPRLVERFEGFLAGREIANAFSELNDPQEQRERFLEQARLRAAGDEEAERVDEDFLVALEHGMPPTGGLGVGIDRLVMALSGQQSIREVILFPQLRSKE
jgi:lysyl-tRNA synthetase class 2